MGSHSKIINNFVYICGFNKDVNYNITSCKKELQHALTYLGTFNSITNEKPNVYVTATGANYGLKMIFNISQINHPSIEGNTGIKIVIHERDDVP